MKKILNLSIIWLLVTGYWLLLSGVCFAEKITVLYTGQTHAALYPCNCPKEPDGGVARRMTKITQLRQENPQALLLDAGGFFAGGAFDDYSQGVDLDKARTEVNLKAMELMGYDAVALSDDELNFGKEYAAEKIKQSSLPFLSANVKLEGVKPYLLKKIGDTTVALIGLTNDEAKAKLGDGQFEDAVSSLEKTIREIRKQHAGLIIALSYLGEDKDREVLEKIKDIGLLISSRYANNPENYEKIGSSFLVRAFWQGRRLSRVDIELEESAVKNITVKQIRLSSEVSDAPQILTILPQCFADGDCRKSGLKGKCNNPATLKASCGYEAPKVVPLSVIQPKNYKVLNQEKVVEFIRSLFPGVEVKFIDSDSQQGKSLIEKVQAKLLPVYLLPKDIKTENNFDKIKEQGELKGEYYYLKPQVVGGSIFVGRKRIFKKLDVFMGTKGEHVARMLVVLKELQNRHKELEINMHFLAIESEEGFVTPNGLSEFEEDLRQVCIKQRYPDKYWDYALCRARRQESSWWDLCAQQYGIDTALVKECALFEQGIALLRENVKLNQELQIKGGPTLVVNNYEVFSVNVVPQIEKLEEMIGLGGAKK